MRLIYTSVKNTSVSKPKKYNGNIFFNKTNKTTSKRQFQIITKKSNLKTFSRNNVLLRVNNKPRATRSMRMFVPFSKTRKCGGCFRH